MLVNTIECVDCQIFVCFNIVTSHSSTHFYLRSPLNYTSFLHYTPFLRTPVNHTIAHFNLTSPPLFSHTISLFPTLYLTTNTSNTLTYISHLPSPPLTSPHLFDLPCSCIVLPNSVGVGSSGAVLGMLASWIVWIVFRWYQRALDCMAP